MTAPDPLPTNSEIADRFLQLADLLQADGAEHHRVLAYRRAAGRVQATDGSVAEMAVEGRAIEIPTIGTTLQAKIVELVETGDIAALARLRDRAPAPEGQSTLADE